MVSIVGWRIALTSPPVPSSGSVSCTKSLIKVDLPVHRGEESMRVSDTRYGKKRKKIRVDLEWEERVRYTKKHVYTQLQCSVVYCRVYVRVR